MSLTKTLYALVALCVVQATLIVDVAVAKNSVEVSKYAIRINNVNYRRKKAEDATLASFGTKRDVAHPFFDHQFDWLGGKLTVKQPTVVTLDSSLARNFDLSAAVDLTNGSGSGAVSGGGTVDAQYTLLKLSLADNYQAVDGVNENHTMLNRLKGMQHPKDIRMVTEVWVLVKGTEAQTSNFSGSAEVTYDNVSGSGSVQSSSGVTFSFSSGSIMAYSFSRLDFDRKTQRKWNTLEHISTDIFRT